MNATILRNLVITLAMSFMCLTAANADEIASECGPQNTPEETWESWYETYVSGEWKRWFECHDKSAQAGLFLSAAISTPNSEGKAQVIDKYGKCESRSRASLECITEDTVANFFYEITILDEESSRTRLIKIWKKEGVRVDGAKMASIERHDEENATGTIQSKQSDGEIDNWIMTFVRVDGRWFVTFKWGM